MKGYIKDCGEIDSRLLERLENKEVVLDLLKDSTNYSLSDLFNSDDVSRLIGEMISNIYNNCKSNWDYELNSLLKRRYKMFGKKNDDIYESQINKEDEESIIATITLKLLGESEIDIDEENEDDIQDFIKWYKDGNDNSAYEFELEDEIIFIRKESILYVSVSYNK